MAESPESKKRKVDEPGSNADWPNLPLVPLTDVYSYLGSEDQYNMAQACENWSKNFSSLHLWRRFVFNLTEDKLTVEPWDLLQSVIDNCKVLEQVFIPYCMATSNPQKIKMWTKQFNRLLYCLTPKAQLHFVEFYHLGSLLASVDKDTYKDVCEVIAAFLASQRKLKRLVFNQCFFEYTDGVDLLKKAIENSKFIRHLVLPAYVKYVPKKAKQEQILPAIAGLQELENVVVDYFLILGRDSKPPVVLETLKKYKRRATLEMLLLVNCFSSSFKRLDSKHWKDLREVNKLLKLEVKIFTDSRAPEQNEFFIVKHIPLTFLLFIFSETCPFERLVHFFNHLLSCHPYEHLLEFVLRLEKSITDFPDAFPRFLTSCHNLKEVKMEMVYPVNGLNVLLESFAQNRPDSLQKFELKISKIGNEENKTMLERLTSNFVQTLKLDVKLDL